MLLNIAKVRRGEKIGPRKRAFARDSFHLRSITLPQYKSHLNTIKRLVETLELHFVLWSSVIDCCRVVGDCQEEKKVYPSLHLNVRTVYFPNTKFNGRLAKL
mmetsp:Transcript_8689/g.25736  ORF Transcript_8689/g.25736 Transcript_8689/m.25736 type:complete len:102 (+) Transcript_8689:5415-5720(+)